MRLSISEIETFLGCRRLYKYKYLTPPFPPPPNKWFAIGNCAHSALEFFHTRIMKGQIDKKIWPGLMSECFSRSIGTLDVHQALKNKVISKGDLYDVKDMLTDYLRKSIRDPIPEVQSTENKFYFRMKGITISGKIDRIDVRKDYTAVIDYKTNSRVISDKDISSSVQLPTYALWVKQQNPGAIVKGEYIFLKFLNRKNGIKTFIITDEMMEMAKRQFREVAAQLNNGCDFRRNSQYKFCRGRCDFTEYCFRDKSNSF